MVTVLVMSGDDNGKSVDDADHHCSEHLPNKPM